MFEAATIVQEAAHQADWQAGVLAFRRGWCASTWPLQHDLADSWNRTRIGTLEVRVHPALSWASAAADGAAVLLLGEAADLEKDTIDAPAIARRLSGEVRANGLDSAIRAAAYLGGRYVCFLASGTELRVVPDCAASMPVFWQQNAAGLALASHSHLLAEITGAKRNQAARELLDFAKTAKIKGTIFLPGMETAFADVKPVLANHQLVISGDKAQHERFYPFPDTAFVSDPESAYLQFRSLFLTHTRLITGFGRTAVSLTAGRDSQATFHAARPHLTTEAFAWTYVLADRSNKDIEEDARIAAQTAGATGVAHRLITLEPSATPAFSEAYQRTYRLGGQHRKLAEAVYGKLPHDIVHLQSMIAEAGTGFYKLREGTPTAERLALVFSRTDLGRSAQVIDLMQRYLAHTDLSAERLGSLDYHDAFYWEVRASRWAAIRLQELDLSHQVGLPFNARGVIEALAGPALELRSKKQALIRLVEELTR